MQITKVLNTYEYSSSDQRQYRYWSPAQVYASGDQLARLLQTGWSLARQVEVEKIWFGDARFITVFRVVLIRGEEQVNMRVMGNPFIRGLLKDPGLDLHIVPHERGADIRFKVIGK